MRINFPDFITSGYSIYEILGQGAFGVVHLVEDRYSAQLYAMKILDKNRSCQDITFEGQLMQRLNHPHITRLYECFESRRKYYIIMDYMQGGTLRQRLEYEGGFFSEHLSNFYFYQMCQAVEYLHSNNIIHRDLKPDNMLLASYHDETLLKLSDFGTCNNCSNCMYSFAGTEFYVAPEIIKGNRYGSKVDIWSLGVILYECSEAEILQEQYHFYNYEWDSVSTSAKSLIKSIFKVNPARRCNIYYILKSCWIDDYEYYNENTLEYLRERYD